MNEKHGAPDAKHKSGCCQTGAAEALIKAIDPVCGMTVDPEQTSHHAKQGGTEFHFCSAHCLAKFTAEPAKFLVHRPRTEPVDIPGAMWTCPMHPEIRQIIPETAQSAA